MTEAEFRKTQAYQDLPVEEKARAIKLLRSGSPEWDISSASAPSPKPDAAATESPRRPLREAEPGEPGMVKPKGYFAATEPRRTGSTWDEFRAPIATALFGPTYSEQKLPEGPYGVVSGTGAAIERGIRTPFSILTGLGKVLEQAAENVPRLWGGEPVSTPQSRAVSELPDIAASFYSPKAIPTKPPIVPPVNLAQEAKRIGIPLSASEQASSRVLARTEGVAGSSLGGGRVTGFREGQEEAAGRAARRIGEDVHPTDVSPGAAGETVIGGANRAETLAREPAETAVAQLGPDVTAPGLHKATTQTLDQAHKAARVEGNARYAAVEQAAGDAPVVSLTTGADRAKAVLAQEEQMAQLGRATPTKAAEATVEVAGQAPATVTGPGGIVQQYGLATGQNVSLKVARDLRSRVRDAMRGAKSDTERRQLKQIEEGITADIDRFADTAPGDIGVKLREADEFWRTRVAEPFGRKSLIRSLTDRESTSEVLEAALFDKRGFERIGALKAEMDRVDPNAWNLVRRRFGNKLMDAAIDPTTKRWSEVVFAEEVAKYSPESLAAIMGDQSANFTKLLERYQKAIRQPGAPGSPIQAAAVFREFINAHPAEIVHGLASRSVDDLATMKTMIPQATWNKVARAWWDETIIKPAYLTPTGTFSRQRFLTQLKKVDDDKITQILGPDAKAEFDTLREILRHQEKLRPLGVNLSGTAQIAIGFGQLSAAKDLAGSLMAGDTDGIAANGSIVLGPATLAFLLTTPRGIAAGRPSWAPY